MGGSSASFLPQVGVPLSLLLLLVVVAAVVVVVVLAWRGVMVDGRSRAFL
jgi:hypothetical protein